MSSGQSTCSDPQNSFHVFANYKIFFFSDLGFYQALRQPNDNALRHSFFSLHVMAQHENIVCPLCGDQVDKLLYHYHIDNEKVVLEKIKEHNPGWTANDGACSRCVDYYHTAVVMQQRMLPEVGPYFPVKNVDDFIILPTPLRLDADARFTGKGVTICFIDSGFYPHPDLIAHKDRIKTIFDITNNRSASKAPPSEGFG